MKNRLIIPTFILLLADEIKRSVSSTYGWEKDYTHHYLGNAVSIVVIILGYLIVHRLIAKRDTAWSKDFCNQLLGGKKTQHGRALLHAPLTNHQPAGTTLS